MTAMKRYKDDFDATKNEILALKKKLESVATTKLTKVIQINKLKEEEKNIDAELKKMRCRSSSLNPNTAEGAHHSHNFGNESVIGRVDNVITAIHDAAEKRRSIVNEYVNFFPPIMLMTHNLISIAFQFCYDRKKTSGSMCSEWGAKVEGLDIDASSKKSIWQKMQRKRVNTVLRPSRRTLVKNLVKKTISSSLDCFDVGKETATDSSVRAEELLLLSLHPESSAGSSLQAEHELGWHICLDVPPKQNANSILHVDTTGLQSQNLLSVCCSTGRQAASFLEPYHLRTLDADDPLSFATKASSLAETNLTCQDKATQGMAIIFQFLLDKHVSDKLFTPETLDADPLSETREQIQLGCSFIHSEVVVDKQQCTKKEQKNQKTTKSANATSVPNTEKKTEKRQKKPKASPRTSSKVKPRKKSKTEVDPIPVASALNNAEQTGQQNEERNYLPDQNKQVTARNPDRTGHILHPAPSVQVEQQQHSNLQQLSANQGNLQQQQQQQFRNFFAQNQLMQVPNGMVLNQQQQGFINSQQQQQQQLQMLRNVHSMQRQQHSQQQLQNQIHNQNQQQMSLNYLQAQQRLSFSQPQIAQLFQHNTFGNNVSLQYPHHQQQQQQQQQQQNFNNQSYS